MNTCKLIFRNVCKNIRDYLIYFLTLTLSVSLFYAFNSISDQPAFANMGMTGTLLYRQLGIMLSTLSTMIAVVLAFLILYANQFLLKRRKKKKPKSNPVPSAMMPTQSVSPANNREIRPLFMPSIIYTPNSFLRRINKN